jgi:3-hydroxyacyl-[acyl-carrier-protein] dehydratase
VIAGGAGHGSVAGQLLGFDRLVAIDRDRGAPAIRNVPMTLDVFDTHFPLFPVLPGVLVLGSLAALGALLLREATDTSWRLTGVERIRCRRFVRPGDRLELVVESLDRSRRSAALKGSALVSRRAVMTVGTLRFVPAVDAEVGR